MLAPNQNEVISFIRMNGLMDFIYSRLSGRQLENI